MLIRWPLGFGSRLLIGGMKYYGGRMRFVRPEKGFGTTLAGRAVRTGFQGAATTATFSSSSLIHDFLVTEAKVENPPPRLGTVLEILKVSWQMCSGRWVRTVALCP